MKILDACCGSKMFWFEKSDVTFIDIRELETKLCDNRKLKISPDIIADFREMPFNDNEFDLVVFDPPHLKKVGDKSWLAIKYGKLSQTWEEDILKGFAECFRVLKENGFLVFKWNETDVKLSDILKLAEYNPLFGNKRPKQSKTHWLIFCKKDNTKKQQRRVI